MRGGGGGVGAVQTNAKVPPIVSYEEQGQTEQATELYTQASSVCPTDPTILTKLAHLYETEGDKAQAFQYYYEV